MRLLFTNVPSLRVPEKGTTIIDEIHRQFSEHDKVEIVVGYASKASLRELDRLVEFYNIRSITLTLGMYYVEGMPEQMHNIALEINQKWRAKGIGEIRLVKTPKYHGKVFLFYKEGTPLRAIVGSANLSVLKPDASTRMQYESAVVFPTLDDCSGSEIFSVIQLMALIEELNAPRRSANIADVGPDEMRIVRTLSDLLEAEPYCESFPRKQVDKYKEHVQPGDKFRVDLKVPSEAEIESGHPPYMGSNINVSYAAGRAGEGVRNWYEVQVHMPVEFLRRTGILKHHPFYVCTDDGYWFKVWTTSGGPEGKQLSTAGGGDRILGKWIKGRLVAAGLVEKPKEGEPDEELKGAITREILERYGCTSLLFAKTDLMYPNDERMSDEDFANLRAQQDALIQRKAAQLKKNGNYSEQAMNKYIDKVTNKNWLYQQRELPVWYLSFAPEE